MEKRKRVMFQAGLFLSFIFVAGVMSGASVHRIYYLRHAASTYRRSNNDRLLEAMKRDLNLSAQQVSALEKTFVDSRKNIATHLLLRCPSVQAYRQKNNELIRALLSPQQKTRFDETNTQRLNALKLRSQ